MFRRILRAVVAVMAVASAAACSCTCNDTAPAPAPAPAPGPVVIPSMYRTILDRHNDYRAKHRAPDLEWSHRVAYSADKWSRECMFEHEAQTEYGENLYAVWGVSNMTKALTQAIDAWYGEAADYNYEKPKFSAKTGHFTAVVWKSTKRLGCSVRKCGPMTIVVCRYDPPGNVEDQFKANVLPPNYSSSPQSPPKSGRTGR